ncbi:MAG: hypothetical protein GY698_00665, partial [Actinomycetia bacterium]|nr:hypothetical protein [Actinomycetes bacterium]
LMLMVHDLINRSPLLVEKGVLTPSRKPPFFELDEEWVKLESGNTKQLLADIKNAKNHVDHARYTLYRFIKIWTVYKLFLNHDYTSDQVRARGLFDAMENFNAYIVMQGFLDLYPKTSRKSKLKFIRELNEVGLVDLNQEINLIESTMELYFA